MGADFLINITNDGWTDKYSGHYQHFSSSVFRAVENGLWMIRAGNTGVSAIIDPAGRVRASKPILKKGSFSGSIDVSLHRTTVYERAGDVILYLAALFISVIIVISVLRRRPGGGDL
jgi:apolipoprotein N-acyltransferase